MEAMSNQASDEAMEAHAMLLARDAYMGAVRMVDEMAAELNKQEPANENAPGIIMPLPANDNNAAGDKAVGQNPFSGLDDPPPQPPKRPRGRPRKHPPPEAA